MKKFLIFLTIITIVFSCSSDNSDEPTPLHKFPTNIKIDSQSLKTGSVLTLEGNGFSKDETYIVTFAKNKIATIIEVNSNYIKVKLPEGAISGKITLTLNNQTKIIGNIEIISKQISQIYIFHNSEKKLAKINLSTGDLTYLGSNIDYGSNTRGAVYHRETNEYIGFENDFKKPTLVRINLDSGATSTISIPSSFLTNGADFDDLIIDDNNELYIFHNSVKKLAKINLSTGDLTYLGSNIDYGSNTRGTVYHRGTNEYIGFENDFKKPTLVRINLDDGSTSTVSVPSSFLTNGADFDDLIIKTN